MQDTTIFSGFLYFSHSGFSYFPKQQWIFSNEFYLFLTVSFNLFSHGNSGFSSHGFLFFFPQQQQLLIFFSFSKPLWTVSSTVIQCNLSTTTVMNVLTIFLCDNDSYYYYEFVLPLLITSFIVSKFVKQKTKRGRYNTLHSLRLHESQLKTT